MCEEMAERTEEEARKKFPEELEHLLCRINSCLGEWRATGRNAEIIDGIRQSFKTLTASAQTTGYQDVFRLSHAVERLMDQYDSENTTDYDTDIVLLNLLEEMHDSLTTVAGLIPDAAEGHLRSLTGIVESLLPGKENETPDWSDRQEAAGSSAIPSPDDPCGSENQKFSYLLDISGELGLTRRQLRNSLGWMQYDLNTLKDGIKLIHGSLQTMGQERDQELQARARKVNRQLDTLARVERQLRKKLSDFADTLIRQSHYGGQLQAGLIKAGMVSETMTPSHVLLVRVGLYRFAILVSAIERAMRVADEEFSYIDGHRFIRANDEQIPVFDLIERISKTRSDIEQSRRSLVLMRSENQITAFEVDEFEETTEVAINSPGKQLASVRGITGVTVLADARIVPVLNPAEFLDYPITRESA